MKRNLITASIFVSAVIYAVIAEHECIFLKYFNIICPGCGMTRAVRALFELDFKSAFEYHPMVFSMPLVFLYILKNGRIIKNKLINNTILILICLGFILNYIIKLIQFYN